MSRPPSSRPRPVAASAGRAYCELVKPERIAEFLSDALLTILDLDTPAAEPGGDRIGRWLFYAQPRARRVQWHLTTPAEAAGTLELLANRQTAILRLSVHTRPASWPAQRAGDLARRVATHIARCLEHSSTGRSRKV